MDESLSEHIRFTAEKGLSRGEIQKILLAAGWPETLVQGYIEKTFKTLSKGTILQVHSIAKAFEQNKVLEQVDFEIKNGEIFGIIGMSGAGKTTLLNLLVGFLKPDVGDILIAINGEQVSVLKNSDVVKSQIGFSTQSPSFYQKLTVRENLGHFARLYHLSESDVVRRCNALIDLVGLTGARDVIAAQLSGGMQKRLDIACALIHDPPILILDEPTADLDPILRRQLWDLIKQINAKGTTILLASHFLAEIELLCNQIAILQHGRIVEMGTAEELRNIYSRNYEVFLQTKSKEYGALLQKGKKYIAKYSEEDGELVVQTLSPEQMLADISSLPRHELVSVHVSRPTLGRVFEAVVKR